jgi:topoisomerase-4 subunit A
LGEFSSDDKIIFFTQSGLYGMTGFDLENHYDDDLILIQKYDPQLIYSAVFYDAEQKAWYLKRFIPELTNRSVTIIGDEPESKLDSITFDYKPILDVKFGGKHKDKDNLNINVDEFIGVKSYKARGKRISTYIIAGFSWLEPLEKDYPVDKMQPEPEQPTNEENSQLPDISDAKQMTLNL